MEKRLKNSEAKQNIPAECGIIQEISCTNFMCHEQLVISLGPLINFIIGHNGSGKSAVLTALTLCLGGKAAATNRGQNLKSFIKEGREYVTIFFYYTVYLLTSMTVTLQFASGSKTRGLRRTEPTCMESR